MGWYSPVSIVLPSYYPLSFVHNGHVITNLVVAMVGRHDTRLHLVFLLPNSQCETYMATKQRSRLRRKRNLTGLGPTGNFAEPTDGA